jgi:aryl-alcohol dehydrogenase-like predicted oxidoreductase
MNKEKITRREFIKGASALAGAAFISCSPLKTTGEKVKRTAADQVTLGKTGLKLSRLGIGTGTVGGSVQRELGHEGFNRLIRYAFDQGITYIDTADSYRTHEWVREAIEPLPREKLFILTKIGGNPKDPLDVLDRFRGELNTDYIDCVLVHCTTHKDWNKRRKRVTDALEKAKDKKIILAHGVSCHSLPALSLAAKMDWVDVNLVRINPQGVKIDTPSEGWGAWSDSSDVPAVMNQIKIMRKNNHGIIGMKIMGEGDFTDPKEREESIRFAMQCGLLDAVVIGFKSTEEIDEAIGNINRALAETT